MAAGTVKFYNEERGFGFIKPDNGERDIFVHVSALKSSSMATLAEGQKVTYELGIDPKGKGPRAENIRRA